MTVYTGETVRITLAVADTASGAGYDPGTLRLVLISPENDRFVYTYGTSSEVTKDSTGNYHADVVLTAPGLWRGVVEAQGSINGATPFSIPVEPISVLA